MIQQVEVTLPLAPNIESSRAHLQAVHFRHEHLINLALVYANKLRSKGPAAELDLRRGLAGGYAWPM